MCCSASGSTPSPSRAWLPAPLRCFWSTGARRPDRPCHVLPKQKPPVLDRRLSWNAKCVAQRFDFLAFFFFLAVFFEAFFAAFLAAFFDFLADFFAEDFFEAFLVFLDFFAATFFAAFLAAFLAAFFFFFLAAGLAAANGGSAAGVTSVIGSRAGFSSSITSPRVYRSDNDSGIRRRVKREPSFRSRRSDFCVGLERALAADPVIDDRFRIGLAEIDAGAFQIKRRGAPWLVDQIYRQSRQFRYPAPDIEAIRIELLALQDRIEHAEIGRCIGTGACNPLPVGGVAAGVGIDQRVPKPLFSEAPVDQEMLDQEGRRRHPHPVVHHPG